MIEILKIIICHIVGDYFLQTDYMASNKGKDLYLLFVHCVCYCIPFLVLYGFVWQIALIFTVHIVVDSLKARYKKINLLTDQIIHYIVAFTLLL